MKSKKIIEYIAIGLVLLISFLLVHRYISNIPIEEIGGYKYYILQPLYEREKINLFDTYHPVEGEVHDLVPDDNSFENSEEIEEVVDSLDIKREEIVSQPYLETPIEEHDNQSYPTIIINDIEKYNNAYNKFVGIFVSKELIEAKKHGKEIEKPKEVGSVDIDYQVKPAYEIVGIDELPIDNDNYVILETEDEIFDYLCFDINTEMIYYETKEGDTLDIVRNYYNYIPNEQLMITNKDLSLNENQEIPVGTKINVTSFYSPLTVTVTKYRLGQEEINPEPIIYIENSSLPSGKMEISVEEQSGLRNVLYEERYNNGFMYQSLEISSEIIKEPIQGIIYIGA